MKKLLNWLYANRSVEEIIFVFILIAGIPYFVTNEVIDLLTNQSWSVGIINTFLILTIVYLLRKSFKGSLNKTHIFLFSLTLGLGFALFWPSSTGLSGAGAYVLQSLIVILLLVNTGKFRVFFAVFLLVMLMVAGFANIEYSGKIVYISQLVSFGINTVVIALVMNLFKIALERERKRLILRIEKLDEANTELESQNKTLKRNQEEILRIQTDLQQIIKDRTREIEKENERIIEYAFINAHLVRAPLANMLGICQLNDSENTESERLQKKMEAMDETVRKIGGILAIDSSKV